MLELNKIYNMDCLEGLKKMENNSVDLVLTDPPYGIDICKNGFVGGVSATNPTDYGIQEWDAKIPSFEVFYHIFRVSKNQILFGGNYFLDFLGKTKCMVIWDKGRRDTNFADCEIIWTSFNKPSRIINYLWDGMRQESMKFKEKRYHPTQKPVEVIRKLLNWFTKEGDSVCDPFAGSGSTAIACEQLNRKFIGFEINPEYYNIIQTRVKSVIAQKKLSDITFA